MSTELLDEFRRKASGMLPNNADNETTLMVAFHLLKLDEEKKAEVLKTENDMQKKLLVLDEQKKAEVLKTENDMQKKLDECDRKGRQASAFHSKQLSVVVQRLV
jgi:hypothetical protein